MLIRRTWKSVGGEVRDGAEMAVLLRVRLCDAAMPGTICCWYFPGGGIIRGDERGMAVSRVGDLSSCPFVGEMLSSTR